MFGVGLKQVSGVAQVTIKRKKNSFFVISRPDVYVSSSCDTYIVFGEARVRLQFLMIICFTSLARTPAGSKLHELSVSLSNVTYTVCTWCYITLIQQHYNTHRLTFIHIQSKLLTNSSKYPLSVYCNLGTTLSKLFRTLSGPSLTSGVVLSLLYHQWFSTTNPSLYNPHISFNQSCGRSGIILLFCSTLIAVSLQLGLAGRCLSEFSWRSMQCFRAVPAVSCFIVISLKIRRRESSKKQPRISLAQPRRRRELLTQPSTTTNKYLTPMRWACIAIPDGI